MTGDADGVLKLSYEFYSQRIRSRADTWHDTFRRSAGVGFYGHLIVHLIESSRVGEWDTPITRMWIAEALPGLSASEVSCLELSLRPPYAQEVAEPLSSTELGRQGTLSREMLLQRHLDFVLLLRSMPEALSSQHETLEMVQVSREFFWHLYPPSPRDSSIARTRSWPSKALGLAATSTKFGIGRTTRVRGLLRSPWIGRVLRGRFRTVLPGKVEVEVVAGPAELGLGFLARPRLVEAAAIGDGPLVRCVLEAPWGVNALSGALTHQGWAALPQTREAQFLLADSERVLESGIGRAHSRYASYAGRNVSIAKGSVSPTYVHAFTSSPGNYFHAMVEGLGTLSLAANAGHGLRGKTILLPSQLPSQIVELVRFLAAEWQCATIPLDRMSAIDGKVEVLCAAPLTGSLEREGAGNLWPVLPFTPEILAALRDSARIFLKSLREGGGGERRILVDRPRGRIEGWGRVADTLRAYGQFETVETGGMTIQEQARLFSSATHVAGEAGSALANLIFCREGTKVFIGQMAGTDVFTEMAKSLGLVPVLLEVSRPLEGGVELSTQWEYWYYHQRPQVAAGALVQVEREFASERHRHPDHESGGGSMWKL